MARNFKELSDALDAKLTPEQRAESAARTKAMLDEIRLAELRRLREMTQAQLANYLGVDQGSVSRMEKQTDMHLSTLREYVEAVGGRLEIRAVFPGETINLTLAK